MKGTILAVLIVLATIQSTQAGTIGPSPDPLRAVVSLSLGPVWTAPGKTQTISFRKDFFQTYTTNRRSNILFSGEVFAGYQAPLCHRYQIQFGLAAAGTTNANLSGEIWQDADPQLDNFVYSYKISHARLALKTKLLTNFRGLFEPYFSASVGPGFNRAYHYRSTPKVPDLIDEPPFNPRTLASVSYTLGAGIQKSLSNHWAAGLGYEFADWGRSKLARAFDQTQNTGLRLSHTFTHQLQFSLTFIV
ncbi:MAG: porin family protein [Tatlockia sp.]|nr:porin family protein [Tatlockia sp.]